MYNGAMVAALTEMMPVNSSVPLVSHWPFSTAAAFWRPDAGQLYRAGKLTGDQNSPGWWLMCALCGLYRDGDAVCTSESRLYRGRK